MRRSVGGLRSSVGLGERLCLLNGRRVDVCDSMAVQSVALDAEDDEKNPSCELEDAADHK